MSETSKEFAQQFYAEFQGFRNDFSALLEAAMSSKSSRQIDSLNVELAKQRTKLIDANTILPSYDQRQCELQLKAFETKLEELRAATAPKAKFAFKRKVAAKPSSSTQSASTITASASAVTSPNFAETSTPSVSTFLRSAEYAYLDASAVVRPDTATTSSDLAISNLAHTVVDIRGFAGIGVVYVNDVHDSVLLLPAIEGSIILHALHRCVLVLSCHQFRMHSSEDVDIYLHILSNPIIEHCSSVRFAPYLPPGASPSAVSKHHDVQDFSHISAAPSPNWSVLPEVERRRLADVPTLTSKEDIEAYLGGILPRSIQ